MILSSPLCDSRITGSFQYLSKEKKSNVNCIMQTFFKFYPDLLAGIENLYIYIYIYVCVCVCVCVCVYVCV